MNRIILIGNGFDLAHGLSTKYIDFIDDFWENFILSALHRCERFESDCIKLELGRQSLTLAHVVSESNKRTYKSLSDQIKYFNSNSQTYPNSKVRLAIENKFLKHISSESIFKSWLDIENEYYKFLCYYVNIENMNSEYYYGSITTLNSDFEYMKTKLEDYLFRIISNKEILPIAKIKEIIFSPLKLKDLSENARKIIAQEELYKIGKYVNDDYSADELNISKKTIPYIDRYKHYDVKSFEQELLNEDISNDFFDLFPDDTLFLNFNYTNLDSLYIDQENENYDVIHIHGELQNIDNPIIFGYGDELEESYIKLENLKENDFLENIKSIKYQETDNYKRLLSFINIDNYQVLILGHSCGNSDRTLLNTLFEHDNCVSIKPYFFKEGKTDNYSDIVRNISRNFTDKKSMRDKVVNKKFCDFFSEKNANS
jgi:hypothetical protein